MPTVATDDLELALGKALVDEIAPEEAEFYDQLIRDYRTSPPTGSSREHPLAFGAEGLVTAIAPYLFDVAKVVLGYIISITKDAAHELAKEAVKAGQDALKVKIKKWIASRLTEAPPVKLNNDQKNALLRKVTAELTSAEIDEATKEQIKQLLSAKL